MKTTKFDTYYAEVNKEGAVIIKAWLLTDQNKDQVLNSVKEYQRNSRSTAPSAWAGWEGERFKSDPCIMIPTNEGELKCSLGDYIIAEPSETGPPKLYPCKAEVFETKYYEVRQ